MAADLTELERDELTDDTGTLVAIRAAATGSTYIVTDPNAVHYVSPPADKLDFSTLPGSVAPTSGTYLAVDTNIVWTIKGGETEWKTSDRITE